jgi:hypothetical protein
MFRQIRQQDEHGDPGQQRVGSNGDRSQAESPEQGACLPAGKARGAGQHGPQQPMQPGKRQVRLRLPAGNGQDPHARRPGPPCRVRQQHGPGRPHVSRSEASAESRYTQHLPISASEAEVPMTGKR